ncbi:MAG: lipid-A-disaccharide synthase [Hyphomicrobiaceae bacterium]
MTEPTPAMKRIFLVAGEHSGDALGARLMSSLKARRPETLAFSGVGGDLMAAQGLTSLFPLSDVAVMGPLAIVKALPRLVRRVNRAAMAAVACKPDAVVIIDSPEFTHPVARRIKRRMPGVPVIDYVCPSVWAWRPGRAARMTAYVDHVMALLPFEPEVLEKLQGPSCTYVGHPLVEHLDEILTTDGGPLRDELQLDASLPTVVVLPGSRRSEVERLIKPFGDTLTVLAGHLGPLNAIIPAVPHVRDIVEAARTAWSTAVRSFVVAGDRNKLMAFKLADAALAASGTVTLELACAGTPMVVAYRVDAVAASLGFLVKTPHFALSNLVLGERAFPELMQENCTPAKLAATLMDVMADSPARQAQLAALARIPDKMRLGHGTPSGAAAEVVLAHLAT